MDRFARSGKYPCRSRGTSDNAGNWTQFQPITICQLQGWRRINMAITGKDIQNPPFSISRHTGRWRASPVNADEWSFQIPYLLGRMVMSALAASTAHVEVAMATNLGHGARSRKRLAWYYADDLSDDITGPTAACSMPRCARAFSRRSGQRHPVGDQRLFRGPALVGDVDVADRPRNPPRYGDSSVEERLGRTRRRSLKNPISEKWSAAG